MPSAKASSSKEKVAKPKAEKAAAKPKAKPKPAAKPKAQPKKKAKVLASDEEEEEASEDGEEEEEDAPKGGKKKYTFPDDQELPPITKTPEMFADLVSHIPDILDVVNHIKGRKLRVATMCSGTESPLLALELIRKSILDAHNTTFEVEHIFSCEIEPFKQAYIERNFQPPLLFRDVCELGNEEATTAYGAKATVPLNADILIAGTSCVDYSNLNNQKKGLDAKGESGETFRGMLGWVCRAKPALVLLENVCSAPWTAVVEKFAEVGYTAVSVRLDTKSYYIPHTRTRGYLLAVRQEESELPDQWLDIIKNQLRRPASASLDAFLLPSDDPRIQLSREKLIKESYNAPDKKSGRTDWNRCESRHHRARDEELLGKNRPLTGWEEGGTCALPDFAWTDWATGQVERVWDLMDILVLRAATEREEDPSYKTQVWNLSQNVDRSLVSKGGLCPCLTPSMIPYITNRGGPMIGLEALGMQGLPVDELLLTRETEDQLADLAGNAMSTTVVGACMLAALVVGKDLLEAGPGEGMEVDKDEEDSMVVEKTKRDRIVGQEKLKSQPLDLSTAKEHELSALIEHSQKSVRLCTCEGRTSITNRKIHRCQDCNATSCERCGGKPLHNPVQVSFEEDPRRLPAEFARELKSTLPMCISMHNVTKEFLQGLKDASTSADIPDKRWGSWQDAVLRAVGEELRFIEPRRQEVWVAVYESTTAVLELTLHPQQPEWRLYAKPLATEPANAEIRKLLKLPIARLSCENGLLKGRWEFALPVPTVTKVTIEGTGDLVKSWEAALGLKSQDKENKMVRSQITVTTPGPNAEALDRDISGVYTLLSNCGTTSNALHKRDKKDGEDHLPDLFLLLDPTRTGLATDDSFVFSISKRRYEFGEMRPVVARLASKWRQSDVEGVKEIDCTIPSTWLAAPNVEMKAAEARDAHFSIPPSGKPLDIVVTNDACCNALALLVCDVPLQSIFGDSDSSWPAAGGEWTYIDRVHERGQFKALAWLLERIRNVDQTFMTWQECQLDEHLSNCERCAPTAPALEWHKAKVGYYATEDTVVAGRYERNIKTRPAPFVTELKLDAGNVGHVQVGINIPSLVHRALAQFPPREGAAKPTVAWRLNNDYATTVKLTLPKFTLPSNVGDAPHAQPKHFKKKFQLRPEQLRSLAWMVAQEASDVAPFIEEEVVEAILEPLSWRAEARAQREVRVRGGVLADQVGYGKTAITLALHDVTAFKIKKDLQARKVDIPGKIAVKATLIIVPPHLVLQWASEIIKFFDDNDRYEVLSIPSIQALNKAKIEDIMDADFIIMASNLGQSKVYLENLDSFAGAGTLPQKHSRYFEHRFERSLEGLATQVNRLREEGSEEVWDAIIEGRKEDEKAEAAALATLTKPIKRLKGKAYTDSKTKPKVKAESVKSEDEEATTPPPPSSKAPSSSPPSSSVHSSSSKPKSKLIGVVIETKKGSAIARRAAASLQLLTSSEDEGETGGETSSAAAEEEPAAKPRRKASMRAQQMIISSDEEEEKPKPKKGRKAPTKKAPAKGKGKAKASSGSDFEEGGDDAESSEDEVEPDAEDDSSVAAVSDEDEGTPPPKAKGKAKAKPAPKPKAKPKKVESSDEEMDVDEEEEKPTNSKKRKGAPLEKKAPAKKKKREESDPWKLKTKAVKADWKKMQAPPLEMFHFARKVIDEYTYLEGTVLTLAQNLGADRHWVLSGTPPTHDLSALKTIAAFLQIHLGIDDEAEGMSAQARRRKSTQQTAREKFISFATAYTPEWHLSRQMVGQRFCDQFMRQNIAEIDAIPFHTHEVTVTLPAAERAIYLELEHHLRALDMTIKRVKKSDGDREKRLAGALGDSKTAEEALLKRCSHFELEQDPEEVEDKENATKACDIIVSEREEQREECHAELWELLLECLDREKEITEKEENGSFFRETIERNRGGIGDTDASVIFTELLEKFDEDDRKGGKGRENQRALASAEKRKAIKAKEKEGKKVKKAKEPTQNDLIWELREKTHIIRRLCKELVGRVRSLRFFTAVRDLQKAEGRPKVQCIKCGAQDVPLENVSILSSCGHMGCAKCVEACAREEMCIHKESGGCDGAARLLNIVRASSLGIDEEHDADGRHFGRKLEMMIELIEDTDCIKAEERVLIFVQFPDLMKKVTAALTHHEIAYLEITGSATAKSKSLEKFQKGDSHERVLLLNVMDESASGANLTCANHAILISPLLAFSQEHYDAVETQAIGRLRRFGQQKDVHWYRFLTEDTIDRTIYEERKKNSLNETS